METAQVSPLLAQFIDSVEDEAILTLNAGGLIGSWNAGAERMTGHRADDVIGRSFACLYTPEDVSAERPRRELELARERGWIAEEGWRARRNGERFWASFVLRAVRDAQGELLGFGIAMRDGTARRQLEERLVEVQKLEAVGRLAGGVAHDFNNLLTIIHGYSSILLATLQANDPARTYVSEIRVAAERASALTRQLLAFSRKHVSAPKRLDVNVSLRETEGMLARLLGEEVTLAMRLADALDPVQADPAQVEQVLINLATDAREAMPAGGQLIIETRNAMLGPGEIPGALPGNYVMIAVHDSGTGARNASDLRLAMLQSFVRHHQGYLKIEEPRGAGRCVRLYLPAHLERTDAGAR